MDGMLCEIRNAMFLQLSDSLQVIQPWIEFDRFLHRQYLQTLKFLVSPIALVKCDMV